MSRIHARLFVPLFLNAVSQCNLQLLSCQVQIHYSIVFITAVRNNRCTETHRLMESTSEPRSDCETGQKVRQLGQGQMTEPGGRERERERGRERGRGRRRGREREGEGEGEGEREKGGRHRVKVDKAERLRGRGGRGGSICMAGKAPPWSAAWR